MFCAERHAAVAFPVRSVPNWLKAICPGTAEETKSSSTAGLNPEYVLFCLSTGLWCDVADKRLCLIAHLVALNRTKTTY